MSTGSFVLQAGLEPETASLGWVIVVLTAVSLTALIAIGWYSAKKNIGNNTADFFSASKSLGFVVIALSVFASVFSGSSFIGHPAETYRSGAAFLVFPQFMIAGLIGALIIAPPLINLGRKWDYTSPIDYIEHRFDSRVAFLVLLLMIWGTFIQFIEQFIAMGYLGQVASGGILSYQVVTVVFAAVIFVYVALGGFRGTAIVAGVQGLLMLLSVCLLLGIIGQLSNGGFTTQVQSVWQTAPEKLTLPNASTMRGWYGLVLLILFGVPTYIHIQQFYLSVKDTGDLQRTFRIQAPIFLFVALILWVVGLVGAGVFPGLVESQSERVVPYLMGTYANTGGGTLFPSLISLGIIMSTLSTAGATVMVLSMAIAKDMYERFLNPAASDGRVINASRLSIAVFTAFAVVVAFTPGLTIWGWVQLKFEFLLQATPAFLFGLYLHRIKSDFVVTGIVVGCLTALGIYFVGNGEVYGINPGIIGFAVNSVVVVGGSYLTGETDETRQTREILRYNAVEYQDGSDGSEVRYVLPGQKKSFWVGLGIVLTLIVPWYAPSSWNAQALFGLPIWTWVIFGALILEALLVVYGTVVWRKRPIEQTSAPVGVVRDSEADD
ncbi:sodium:solute symporter family protein [Natrialba taiwanensis]|uniref:Sodium:pantothenate symporter n=1 Tax=Natrialba taiwanensis DSM 12281 TaxID=1230458 RepID=L9ZIH2_9EURY|nr:sodium:solute symporter family protein [Natrialba taiwanensis]ELY86154.1 sodium:pantothenate symporter [Natrialba taiwanensis DSM 12281]